MGQKNSSSGKGRLEADTITTGATPNQNSVENERVRALNREEEEKRNRSRAEVARLKLIIERFHQTEHQLDCDGAAFEPFSRLINEKGDLFQMLCFFSGVFIIGNPIYTTLFDNFAKYLYLALFGGFVGLVYAANKKRGRKFEKDESLNGLLIGSARAVGIFLGFHVAFRVPVRFGGALLVSFLLPKSQDLRSQLSKKITQFVRGYSVSGTVVASDLASNDLAEVRGLSWAAVAESAAARADAMLNNTEAPDGEPIKNIDQKYSNITLMLARGTSEPADPSDDKAPTCTICLFNKPDVAFIPCGHVRCCVECVRSLCRATSRGIGGEGDGDYRCPDCRTVIEQVFYPAKASAAQ